MSPTSQRNVTPKHLQLCITRHRRYTQTRYTSHSLNMDSDKTLHDLLRKQYTELVGRWKRLLSLRQISQIRFVKFRLHTNKLVTIETHSEMEARIRESLPQENDEDYKYAPPEPVFLPPIGHNETMHYSTSHS
ncbi:hypothetical protein P171DRAFT_125938 [Karstenula rhodostoma CBS 690.94]|uniref:Uncharacterized protein n=1 Tax=Karstenula rhodostoma CBS 690.94 TaxID=1392251 RepID=A0A9P4PAR9_9PLEO|nr:hypothetical protein P171DRAFT_125938 [Karstenula rhodostoma CBS 690.94]